MEGCEGAPKGAWCTGVVREVRHPTPDAVLLRLEVAGRTDHLPGQHYVFRLTAEDGYTASRSYSVASAPGDPLLEFYVEPGDELELRGPIGGWFVWEGDAPAVGVAGGTGVVPLVAMLRHARDIGREDLVRLLVSARSRAELPYAEELTGQALVLTREAYDGRAAGRVTAQDLAPLVEGAPGADVYVCGSAGFAEAASGLLIDLGVSAAAVRVERFGPTG